MEVFLPNFDVNEQEATITDIYVEEGSYVRKGDALIGVENTKRVKDIEAPADGYIKLCCKRFEVKKMGEVLAHIFSEKADYDAYEDNNRKEEAEEKPVWNATKKAAALAQKLNIDMALVAKEKGEGLIKTEDVENFAENSSQKKSSGIRERINQYDRERVVVIGAGKGAEIVIDILMDDRDKYIVGLVDSFEREFPSYSYPLLSCTADDFPKKIERSSYDTVIFSIGSTLKTMAFRKTLFEEYQKEGIPFTNAVAEDANIRRAVKLGVNNVIMHNCYIGTGTEIGDNNMISYGMNMGHHCILGSNNLIAPGLTTAGCVEIGNDCIIMTGVNTRSFVKIGNGVVLPVGYAVNEDIADRTIIQ